MGEEPPKKKRKLPALDEVFEETSRKEDSPELHQGRKRAHRHVPGQWACHVFVELSPTSNLSATLRKAIRLSSDRPEVKERNEPLHSLLQADLDPTAIATSAPRPPPPLHISLSRPLMLQTNQRDDLRVKVSQVASSHSSFGARYASFGVLENDEKTRRFLGIELGSGYDNMNAIVKALDVQLVKMRLPAYYAEPRFHTSIAWTSETSDTFKEKDSAFNGEALAALDSELGSRLRDDELWVADLCLKVGKETTRFPLK